MAVTIRFTIGTEASCSKQGVQALPPVGIGRADG
jgi:hypothetical protein